MMKKAMVMICALGCLPLHGAEQGPQAPELQRKKEESKSTGDGSRIKMTAVEEWDDVAPFAGKLVVFKDGVKKEKCRGNYRKRHCFFNGNEEVAYGFVDDEPSCWLLSFLDKESHGYRLHLFLKSSAERRSILLSGDKLDQFLTVFVMREAFEQEKRDIVENLKQKKAVCGSDKIEASILRDSAILSKEEAPSYDSVTPEEQLPLSIKKNQ